MRLTGSLEKVEEEPQRINIEQNDKKQHARQKTCDCVVQTVAAAKFVMRVSDRRQHGEAKRKCGEAVHRAD
jgi:hypothetical protein